ncbi:hypothetical protein D3C76_259810 [compost metagenome]
MTSIEFPSSNPKLRGAKRRKSNARVIPLPHPVNVLTDNGDGQVNLLAVEELLKGLVLEISRPPAASIRGVDTFVLYKGDIRLSASHPVNVPYEEDDFPFQLRATDSELGGHGAAYINYRIENSQTPDYSRSDPVTISIDLLDPNANAKPLPISLPADLSSGVITKEYLETHPTVTFTGPRYADPRLGDRFKFLLDTGQVSPTVEGLVEVDEDDGTFAITVSSAAILASGTGTKQCSYRLIDRAGNETSESYGFVLRVVFVADPADLQAPIVELAPIDRDDARAGVFATIRPYTNSADLDQIILSFNGRALPIVTLPIDHELPITIPLTFATLDSYTSPYSATVQYIVRREGISFPSPEITVDVDLRTVGPDPEGPGLVNPELDIPVLHAPVSGLTDQLTLADVGEEVEFVDVTFDLYSPVNPGEHIKLFYGPLFELAATFDVVDEAAGDEITMQIPIDVVKRAGNGSRVPLFYQISADSSGSNAQRSETKFIEAHVADVRTLPEAVFPFWNAAFQGFYCAERPWEGIKVRVSAPDELQDGDEVKLHWILTDASTGTPLESIISYELSGGEGAGNIDILVSYEDYIQPSTAADIQCFWSYERAGIEEGRSEEIEAFYNIRLPGGGFCPGSGVSK